MRSGRRACRPTCSSIDEEREQLKLLRAEWSLLNDPGRLQRLVERYNDHLNLQPLEVEQITRIEDVPIKPMKLEPIGGERAWRLCRHAAGRE
ncbi:MAG: hypothetical protein HPM95_08505 [Alphaproteobacteria bacterium]|nr:hypothetical protein [Alphaproteobacteria bacterium]